MRHHKTGKKLDRKRAGRRALFRSLAVNLIKTGRIRTTEAKAKALRPYIEPLVTKARVPSDSTRRYLLQRLHEPAVVLKLLKTIGPKYKERRGGYTRIVKVGARQGDAAKQAIIEFVD